MYAKVVVRNNSVHTDSLFTYKIPDFLLDEVKIGHRVLVPFGMSNKPIEGFVFDISSEYEQTFRIKNISDILDETPIFSIEDLELVRWMKNRYLCTYIDCINMIYPKGYKVENYKSITLNQDIKNLEEEEFNLILEKLNDNQKEIIYTIYTSKSGVKISKFNKIKNINSIVHNLQKKGIVEVKWNYNSNINEKKIKYISLAMDKGDIDEYISQKIKKLGNKQIEVINYLKDNKIEDVSILQKSLNITRSTIKSLEEKELIQYIEKDFYRSPKNTYEIENKDIKLNIEQEKVIDTVVSEMFLDYKKPYLLHGITGSGKTEVYMEIIDYTIKQGMDAIVLVPEISLTPQTISRFKNKFKDIVGVFHSQLSEGEKHDVYKLIKQGKIRILIGARSALFAPFNSLGVVIIDEAHESSYKSDKNPKFSSIEVAKYLAIKKGISLILGSATPSVEEYYRAKTGEYKLLEIKQRANKKPLPKIELVDMSNELSMGNKSIFSYKLLEEIKNTIANNNQVILFLNRRGYASFVSCRECGYVFKCHNCDISLTYHKKENTGRCHYCGYEKMIPQKCPECESTYIKPFGVGTQKIEEELQKLIQGVKILRMDKDTTSKKGSIEEILTSFKNQEADVLIGTQMLSKGLDFDNVTLVGILSADMMLKFPDFKSSETTFQLITQVAGRAGRSDKEGKVILQTYDKQHYAIQKSLVYDYEGFYNDEIKIRKAFEYTPFNNMISVVISGDNEISVRKNAQNMYDTILYLLKQRNIDDFEFILGPNPCAISKINQNYRYQILFKDDNIEINLLKGIIKYICITKRESVFTPDVNISIDINPNSIL